MSEIVERLHRLAGLGELIHVEDWKRICVALANGANHIEALEDRNRKLEEALKNCADDLEAFHRSCRCTTPPTKFEVAHLEFARAALSSKGE